MNKMEKIVTNFKIQELKTEIQSLDLCEEYNEKVSYCGIWAGNSYRSKLKLYKILPFNRFCYIHDKGYFLLNEYFKYLSFFYFLYFKFLIDYIFLKNMINATREQKNVLIKIYKIIVSFLFISIVILATPLYYAGFWRKNKNKRI